MTNDQSTLPITDSEQEFHVSVNSIQQTLFVERLPMPSYDESYRRVKPYDIDNLYPNKIKSIAERSSTVESAMDVLSRFIEGNGFGGIDTIVNERENLSAYDILEFVSQQYALFRGYALHFNYNELGYPTDISPVNFEFVRWNRDCSGFIVNPFWGRYYGARYEVEYNEFNLDTVREEIAECGGIDNYKGQILYVKPRGAEIYPRCFFDSVLDDAQFEAEAKLYSLRSIQNDYALSGVIAYPKQIEGSDEIKELKKDFKKDQGSKNAGGFRVFGAPPSDGMQNWKWFTPISRNNIDKLHAEQKKDARMSIYHKFNQPPILSGVSTDGMFNTASFLDAFNYYNAYTEKFRKKIEKSLSPLFEFFGIPKFEIEPVAYENYIKNNNEIE